MKQWARLAGGVCILLLAACGSESASPTDGHPNHHPPTGGASSPQGTASSPAAENGVDALPEPAFRTLNDVADGIGCGAYNVTPEAPMIGVTEATCVVDQVEVTLDDWSFLDHASVLEYLQAIADGGYAIALSGQFSVGAEDIDLIRDLAAGPLGANDVLVPR